MYWCYALVQNYGLAIILFTLLTKVVLLPFSIWLHKNGIKIVKLQAKINTVKAEYYGDAGMIAEKQSELYKQEKYNPLVNLIPIMIQLILLMGLELGKTSIEKILHPEPVDFSPLIFAILCASILVKLYMFLYNRRLGKKLASPAMEATAMDSLSDSVATAAVLIATLVGRFTGLEIDGWCGVLVAAFILWSGINAVRDTLDPLLGTPPTHEFVQRIRDLVMAHSTILGIHDLIVHDYGPGRVMISLHAEVPANEDVLALHDEIDNVEKELREKLGCDAVIHMDPVVTDDGVTEETRRRVQTLIHCIDDAIDIHDFRMVAGPTHTNLIFDAVVPFGFRLTDQEVEQKIRSAVRALDGNYYAVVNVERSYT